MQYKLLIIPLFCFAYLQSKGQIPVGEWREHFSYRQVHDIAESENKIYAAAEQSLFSYDKEDASIEKISKINKLSDAGISCISYNSTSDILIIAYINSNIDVLKNGSVYNLSDIKRKQISGDKSINSITNKGKQAYLNCGFGIVVFDTESFEFSDTYYIGEDAGLLNVNKLVFDEQNFYIASSNGIYQTNYTENYPGNYQSWEKELQINNPDGNYSDICIFNEQLYVVYKTEATAEVLRKNGNLWETVFEDLNSVNDIVVKDGKLIVSDESCVCVYDSELNPVQEIKDYNIGTEEVELSVQTAVLSASGNLLIADNENGLLIINEDSHQQILPNGPANNFCGKLQYESGYIYAASSTVRIPSGKRKLPAYYNRFYKEEWTYGLIEDLSFDLVNTRPKPDAPDEFYAATWGHGMFEFSGNEQINHYSIDNSSLQAIPGDGNPYIYTLVYDMKYDNAGNLWISNGLSARPLCLKTKEGEWYNYRLNSPEPQWLRHLLVRHNGDVWIDLYRNGLYVFNNNGTPDDLTDDKYKYFYPQTGEDNESEKEIRIIKEDKNGVIWVGTIQGIFVYYEPDIVLAESGYPRADRIKITQAGTDVTTQYLFKTETVTDIEVDGANRKWIATQSSGLYLVSEDGKEEIHNFKSINSPLPSDRIIDIKLNEKTGELFVSTDAGLVSFRSQATEAQADFGDVYVFPNPVRPGYTGKITVTGLAENVNVKFTDISGGLVYETEALGGQAVWDGKRFDGSTVNSGVYLIFASNKDGSETYVSKLLFIK